MSTIRPAFTLVHPSPATEQIPDAGASSHSDGSTRAGTSSPLIELSPAPTPRRSNSTASERSVRSQFQRQSFPRLVRMADSWRQSAGIHIPDPDVAHLTSVLAALAMREGAREIAFHRYARVATEMVNMRRRDGHAADGSSPVGQETGIPGPDASVHNLGDGVPRSTEARTGPPSRSDSEGAELHAARFADDLRVLGADGGSTRPGREYDSQSEYGMNSVRASTSRVFNLRSGTLDGDAARSLVEDIDTVMSQLSEALDHLGGTSRGMRSGQASIRSAAVSEARDSHLRPEIAQNRSRTILRRRSFNSAIESIHSRLSAAGGSVPGTPGNPAAVQAAEARIMTPSAQQQFRTMGVWLESQEDVRYANASADMLAFGDLGLAETREDEETTGILPLTTPWDRTPVYIVTPPDGHDVASQDEMFQRIEAALSGLAAMRDVALSAEQPAARTEGLEPPPAAPRLGESTPSSGRQVSERTSSLGLNRSSFASAVPEQGRLDRAAPAADPAEDSASLPVGTDDRQATAPAADSERRPLAPPAAADAVTGHRDAPPTHVAPSRRRRLSLRRLLHLPPSAATAQEGRRMEAAGAPRPSGLRDRLRRIITLSRFRKDQKGR